MAVLIQIKDIGDVSRDKSNASKSNWISSGSAEQSKEQGALFAQIEFRVALLVHIFDLYEGLILILVDLAPTHAIMSVAVTAAVPALGRKQNGDCV